MPSPDKLARIALVLAAIAAVVQVLYLLMA
jgi:hypothetical protein